MNDDIESPLFRIPFALITAWGQHNEECDRTINEQNNLLLEKTLKKQHFFYDRVVGQTDHLKRYFCIYNISFDKAISLSKDFSQNLCFYNNTRTMGYYNVDSSQPVLIKDVIPVKKTWRPSPILTYVLDDIIEYKKQFLHKYNNTFQIENELIELLFREQNLQHTEDSSEKLIKFIKVHRHNTKEVNDNLFTHILNEIYKGFADQSKHVISLLELLNELKISWWGISTSRYFDKLIKISNRSDTVHNRLIVPDPYDDIFIELCILAEKEEWCSDISCSTCGHIYYRYAFKELVKGIRPSDQRWCASKYRQQQSHNKYPNSLTDTELNSQELQVLEEILSKTDRSRLQQVISNPSVWQGAIALVEYTVQFEKRHTSV